MNKRINQYGLAIDHQIHDLVTEEILPGLSITADQVWQSMATLLEEFQPRNQTLLAKRTDLESKINAWHERHTNMDVNAYQTMLDDIGYLMEEPLFVQATTAKVDDEIASIAGPQLVVPVNNARYAINAANARWGSLYDALYGTDALPGTTKGTAYDPKRGANVIAFSKQFLDKHFPLQQGNHRQVTGYSISNGNLVATL
jgi:malate synthase